MGQSPLHNRIYEAMVVQFRWPEWGQKEVARPAYGIEEQVAQKTAQGMPLD